MQSAPVARKGSTRLLLALLPPLAAVLVQHALRQFLEPAVWFVFYPALFLSSWIGGLRAAVIASVLAAGLALWLVVPEEHAVEGPVARYLAAGVLVSTGVLFGVFHDRLWRTTEAASEAARQRRIFAALVDASSDFIGIADPSGKPIYVNPAGRRMVGLAPDQNVGDTKIPEYYTEDQRPFANDVIVKAMVEQGQWKGETSFRHWQTQAAIPVSDTHFLIREPETGEVLGMGTITRDISEMRLAEAKATGILSIAADAIISIDEHERILLFNAGAEKIFGYSSGEALGAQLEMLIPERLRAVHHEHVKAFAAGTASSRRVGERGRDIIGLRKNGEEFPADASISKLTVGDTRLLTVALRDVTDRKRFEREQMLLADMGQVLTSSLDTEKILAGIGELTTRTFADACVVYAIDEAGEIHHLDASVRDPEKRWVCDVLRRATFDRARSHEMWSELEAHRSVLLDKITPESVVEFAQSEEHLRVLQALDPRSGIMAPLVAHGRLIGAMALMSSTPGRAYTMADVRFAEKIAVRAAFAVENARLYAEAQRAIETRDDVLGIVAHDLRNPLGAILMHAELVLASPDSAKRAADSIVRSAMRMNRLIEDLLDVTLIEQKGLSVSPAAVATSALIAEVSRSHEAAAAAASVDLRVDVPAGLPDVRGDRDRLLQVLENLIGNALKFTPAGGLVTMGAMQRASEVLFWVADTGVGIAPDEVPHVFDRFWQARRGRRSGAGLGLAIARGIVEAHGGRMWIESTLGRGTTFFFTIPAASQPQHVMT